MELDARPIDGVGGDFLTGFFVATLLITVFGLGFQAGAAIEGASVSTPATAAMAFGGLSSFLQLVRMYR